MAHVILMGWIALYFLIVFMQIQLLTVCYHKKMDFNANGILHLAQWLCVRVYLILALMKIVIHSVAIVVWM